MRVRTAVWWPPARLARPDRPSPRGGLRFAVLAVVMVAAGMTAGSAPAASQPPSSPPAHTSASTASAGNNAIWTVYPGGSFKASGPVQLADTKTGKAATCTSLTLKGTLQSDIDTGVGVGSITAVSATGCTVGATTVKLTAHGLPWSLNAMGYKSGVTTGTISGIDLVASGSGCSATLDGTAAGAGNGLTTVTYTNSTGKLTLGGPGNLHWWSVSGCSGAVGTSDPAQASAAAPVTPKQTIFQYCLPYRPGIKLNKHFPVPKPPKGARKFVNPLPGCAYVAGFTNAKKLGEAAFVGPAYADLIIGLATYETSGSSYIQINNAGLAQYHGQAEFPPARSTLLGFGFMPVSATLQLTQIGTFNAIFVDKAPGHFGCKSRKKDCAVTTITARLDLRLYDVSVNGTPLNVGPHCQTATPFTVTLKGKFPEYSIETGGPLVGTINIPPFKGCSNGADNLDPIFTASVSGPGNETLLTQAAPCVPYSSPTPVLGCPPAKPKPIH